MERIIDFHTHAFPDALADKAVKLLEKEGDVPARLDGRISSLISSMDECGIEASVVCSIATKPSQFLPILNWSKGIASDRILPFPSIHPDDDMAVENIAEIRKAGFLGIKMHPYYQSFDINEERLFRIYSKIAEENLILVLHTGFDFAFPRDRIATPEKIIRISDNFPCLKLVTTHMGAWDDWEDVRSLIVGRPVYMEISYSLDFLSEEHARDIILNHPSGYVFFGTDSPWTEQKNTINLLKKLSLEPALEKQILRDNASALLESVRRRPT